MSRRISVSYQLSSPAGEAVFKRDDDPNVLTWNHLSKIEDFRREILHRVEMPFWKVLTYWTGTCLRALTWDPMIWVAMVVFGLVRYHARTTAEMPQVFETLGDSFNIEVIGGFLSFFLVLFVNQTNTRYFDMYKLAKASAGRVQDIAGLAAANFPQASAHRINRYMNAAHIAGYVGLGGPYKRRNFFDHFNKKHNLLTGAELARLEVVNGSMDLGSAVFKELITWCQKDIYVAQKAGHVDSYQVVQLHGKILDLRAAMDGIYDYCDQPIPFFYIHFICLLTAFYLPLFAMDAAYSSGWGDEASWRMEILNALLVLLLCIFVIGLRVLGQRMIDPFGMDLEDLSVLTYAITTIENCRIILASQDASDVNETMELDLSKHAGSSTDSDDSDTRNSSGKSDYSFHISD